MISLSTSIVGFADALGTTSFAADSQQGVVFLENLVTATTEISSRISTLPRVKGINVRWFSDSIAMSIRLTGHNDIASIIDEMTYMQAHFAVNGIFLRGGIAKGGHYHGDYIDFGPALAEAVDLERRVAGNAVRIVLSTDLDFEVRQGVGLKDSGFPVVLDTADGRLFLDFVGFLTAGAQRDLREHLELQYRKLSPDSAAAKKLEWLASYFTWRTGGPTPIPSVLPNYAFEML